MKVWGSLERTAARISKQVARKHHGSFAFRPPQEIERMDHLDLIHETADRKAAVPVLLRTPTRETRHFDCKCCGHLLYEWNFRAKVTGLTS